MVQIHLCPQLMDKKVKKLIEEAQKIMANSPDPIHALDHVSEVARYAEIVTKDMSLNEHEKDAVILAAWWHDVGRTVTKKPSMIWMPFFDDLLSGFMLWKATFRQGVFGTTAGLSTRIIFCKSLGTGAVLTKFLLRKKRRILVDVIKDADALDILNLERTRQVMLLAESSWRYHHGYKIMTTWFLKTNQLHMKTTQAKKHIEKIMTAFIKWFKEKEILFWHIKQFGYKWVKKTIEAAEKLLRHIIYTNTQTIYSL